MKVLEHGPLRTLCFIAGIINLVLAVAGVVLPLMPAAPFIILSAYFFSKSSKKFHDGLRTNRYTGHIVTEWEDHGVMTSTAKIGLTAFVVSSFGYSLWFGIPKWIQISIGVTGAAFLAWVWTRPGQLPKKID
ncbi:MAG: YbaN family protein [Bdellovibrionia bacterium]